MEAGGSEANKCRAEVVRWVAAWPTPNFELMLRLMATPSALADFVSEARAARNACEPATAASPGLSDDDGERGGEEDEVISQTQPFLDSQAEDSQSQRLSQETIATQPFMSQSLSQRLSDFDDSSQQFSDSDGPSPGQLDTVASPSSSAMTTPRSIELVPRSIELFPAAQTESPPLAPPAPAMAAAGPLGPFARAAAYAALQREDGALAESRGPRLVLSLVSAAEPPALVQASATPASRVASSKNKDARPDKNTRGGNQNTLEQWVVRHGGSEAAAGGGGQTSRASKRARAK
jgi:hypothetical protein